MNTQTGRAVSCGGKDTDQRLGLPRIEEFAGEVFDLVLGHRRLSILDLSPAGHQPMVSAAGKLWLAYNGEVYNYVEPREELKGLGHVSYPKRYRGDARRIPTVGPEVRVAFQRHVGVCALGQ
ncbi:MAG: hypothetical protein IPM84_01350 [Anaerolineae bacterium]|nr:hypothetical protein [Anaerolineae bacterium]